MSNPRRRTKEAASARRPAQHAPPPRQLPPGAVALRDWIAREKLSHADLANQLGVTRQHVGMMLAGSPPSLGLAVMLEDLTGIKCSAWISTGAEVAA